MGTRLNVSLSEADLALLKLVVPPRKLSSFIKEAAVERARALHRERLRQTIVSAYEADPEFLQKAGQEWDAVAHESWPPP